MNEPKSSRYHRLRRRVGLARGLCTIALLLAALRARPDLPVWAYVLALSVVIELATLPFAFYLGVVLERRYEMSTQPLHGWVKDEMKGFVLGTAFAVAAGELVYALIRWSPRTWWLFAAVGAAAFVLLMARLAPVLLLPLFYRVRPLERPALAERLTALSAKAGVRVLGVYQWGLGAKTRRANAALAGTGSTRRILLSDTLLAEYSDDEIEVILAHELAHHVHRDIPKTLALEFLLLASAFYLASLTLDLLWMPLGLNGPADVGGLPLLVLSIGAVMFLTIPLVNCLSRRNERRADGFALALTRRREAFVTAMRRLGAQNLSEENPSRLAIWLFHTHPTVEERIRMASER